MVRWIENNTVYPECSKIMELMDVPTVSSVRRFHESFPQYSVTPLRTLTGLAKQLGVGGIYVKDESFRFGLNSFKALGCTFAIASYIGKEIGCTVWELDYKTLPDAARKLGQVTFFAATDGNHGRAVAWAARKLGQNAVIYMNKGCPRVRLEHILEEGADGAITELNYDDTIRYVKELASKTPNSTIIQDTAWEGYEDIPTYIMQGYAVMALEACEQLYAQGVRPTHIITQAGVGAFAASAQAMVANFYGSDAPIVFTVEPNDADCYYRSIENGGDEPVNVGGDMQTIMAGLACGEPSTVAWKIIRNRGNYFAAIDDCHTKEAMRVLGNPPYGDERIVSGESGAAGMGFLLELLRKDDLAELREKAGINKNSRILVFSTEGDTDPENYRRIVGS